MKQHLPIDKYLEDILKKIQESSTVLIKASPGSGKTTRLPWFVAKNVPGKVLVLEPRRLAAKLAAERIAQEENLGVGSEIGYQFRFENRTSPTSRLLFYTEGTFLRLLMNDPDLKDISVVILDEFHERHLETDMALAYLLGLQKKRPDLKLVLMSATLDTKVLGHLPDSQTIEIEAPNFPVTVSYLPNVPSELNRTLEQKVKTAVLNSTGDTLVFLPGMREILKVKASLGENVFILHSEAPKEEQDFALAPGRERKIILSTNIAESSITIPGIETVIDSGIQRSGSYSPWTGLKQVVDSPVTKASAIQRAGRAGRTGPGVCLRLYGQLDFNQREDHTVPEIQKADLLETYLLQSELKGELLWPSPPPPERWKQAGALAKLLGLTDETGKLTETGKRSRRWPLEARLARVLVAGEKLKKDEKRKLLRFICTDIEKDQSGRLEKRLASFLDLPGSEEGPWEKCLMSGFVDQLARYRQKQHDLIHYSGKTLKAHYGKSLHGDFFLVLDITQRQEAIGVIPVEIEWAYDLEPFPFEEEVLLDVGETFRSKVLTKIGSIVVEETSSTLDWKQLQEKDRLKLIELGARGFEKRLTEWKSGEFYEKLHYWARLKNLSMEKAEEKLTLTDYMENSARLSWDDLLDYLRSTLEAELSITNLSQLLPPTVNFGGRRDMKVHYPLNQEPFTEGPIQDFYGVKETPRIAGSVPLTMRLLGPHKRPIQVTKDLAGFWKKTYQDMKKELARDYPRHYWPDDPANAKPFLLKSHLPKA